MRTWGGLMAALGSLNLIQAFTFYLATMFLLSCAQRVRQYRSILALVRSFPSRWPRLLKLVHDHRNIFLTWSTLTPALLTLCLWIVHTFTSRFVWPEAGRPPHGLTLASLWDVPTGMVAILILGLAVLVVDVFFLFDVGDIPRAQLEKSFDQAEYWLNSWAASVVKAVTFGFINPRQMVAAEVRTALQDASQWLNTALWRTVLQMGLRFAYGSALWLTFVLKYIYDREKGIVDL